MISGCAAPGTGVSSAEPSVASASRTAAETEAAALLTEAGVVGDSAGAETLRRTIAPLTTGVSQAFLLNAKEILTEWYVRSSLDPAVLNASDRQAAIDLVFTDFDLMPDLGTTLQTDARPAEFITWASYMGDTVLLGAAIPTYAEFDSYASTVDDAPVQVLILRASSIYTVESPEGTAELIVIERQLSLWAPAGVDEVSPAWKTSTKTDFFGADECQFIRDLVVAPSSESKYQAEARDQAKLVVSGAAQTQESWDSFDDSVDESEQNCR